MSSRPRPPLVLIVDDEIAFRDVLAHVLREVGYRVEVAGNGVDALAQLRREAPALMLLDLVMPLMGGEEVLVTMASDARLATVPVLVLSGSAEVIRSGGTIAGVVKKPVNLEALLQVISSVVPR